MDDHGRLHPHHTEATSPPALLGGALSLLIAPPSTVVMNDLPASKAGDGSSLNMVSRFVGAAGLLFGR